MNEQFLNADPLQVLSEGQSLQAYKRMRLSQSFEKPSGPNKNPNRKHSPNFNNVEWDKDNLYKKLSEWPIGEPINWTQTADEFHINRIAVVMISYVVPPTAEPLFKVGSNHPRHC